MSHLSSVEVEALITSMNELKLQYEQMRENARACILAALSPDQLAQLSGSTTYITSSKKMSELQKASAKYH